MLVGRPQALPAFPLGPGLNGVFRRDGGDLGKLDENGLVVGRERTVIPVRQHEHAQQSALHAGNRHGEHSLGHQEIGLRIAHALKFRKEVQLRCRQPQGLAGLHHVRVDAGAALRDRGCGVLAIPVRDRDDHGILRPQDIGDRVGRGPMGADDQARLIGGFAEDDLGQPGGGDARAGGRKGRQLLLVPMRPRQKPLPFLFDQHAVRDVVMGDDRKAGALMVETGGSKLEPAFLTGRVAGIFKGKAALAGEHGPDPGSRRTGAGCIPTGGAVADVEIVDPN